jgi:hypothetical protein
MSFEQRVIGLVLSISGNHGGGHPISGLRRGGLHHRLDAQN